MFQFEHPCVLMQTGLKFCFTAKHHMSCHTAQLKVCLLMKIIQNYSIAKINSVQLLSVPNVTLLSYAPFSILRVNGIMFSHTQDALTRSSNQPCPRISIICYPSPLATALHSARGLTDLPLYPLCAHNIPFQIYLKDLQTNYTSSLFLKKNTHKEQWLWPLNPSSHLHQLVLIGLRSSWI